MKPTYASDYVEQRSRLTTFFRYLLAIPHFILAGLWGLAVYVAVILAWFAIVVTGRFPTGLYDFIAAFLRYSTAITGYLLLLTDESPPFGGDTDGYPVRLHLGPPLERYSRAKTFFRAILIIPVALIAYAMNIVAGVGSFIAWFAIVILGRQPEGLQNMINLGVGYQCRANAYMLLVSEDFPPFENPPLQPSQPSQPIFGA